MSLVWRWYGTIPYLARMCYRQRSLTFDTFLFAQYGDNQNFENDGTDYGYGNDTDYGVSLACASMIRARM